MENVILISFRARADADAAVEALRELQAGSTVEVRALVVMDRLQDGVFRMVESMQDTGIAGRSTGAALGALAGVPAGPLGMLVGGLTGGAVGRLVDARSADDSHLVVDAVTGETPPGSTAVIADVEEDTPAIVDDRMRSLGGHVRRWSLSQVEAELAPGEDVAAAAREARRSVADGADGAEDS